MNALDPNQIILYKLFRDSTKYENGHHIKVDRSHSITCAMSIKLYIESNCPVIAGLDSSQPTNQQSDND